MPEKIETRVFRFGKKIILNVHPTEDEKRVGVYIQRDQEELYGEWLCDISTYNGNEWFITFRGSREVPEEISRLRWPDYRSAIDFYLPFSIAVRNETERHPLPDDVRETLESWSRSLYDERKELDSRYHALMRRRWELKHLADKYNLTSLAYQNEDTDKSKALRELLEFEWIQEQGVPFFSEKVLYELVGKEDARTILALLRNVAEHVDPEIAKEI